MSPFVNPFAKPKRNHFTKPFGYEGRLVTSWVRESFCESFVGPFVNPFVSPFANPFVSPLWLLPFPPPPPKPPYHPQGGLMDIAIAISIRPPCG